MIVPTLDDLARMSVTVRFPGCESEYVWSATCSDGGTWTTWSGLTRPSSRAAARVITLLTEPGS